MTKILFVCLGNICRSPMAEAVMKKLAAERGLSAEFEIASAGTSDEERGNGVYPPAARKLREKGVEVPRRGAVRMTAADYAHYDLLIGMEERNLAAMRRIAGGDPAGKIRRLLDYTDRPGDVADPWYTGDFETAYGDILRGCEALLDALCRN